MTSFKSGDRVTEVRTGKIGTVLCYHRDSGSTVCVQYDTFHGWSLASRFAPDLLAAVAKYNMNGTGFWEKEEFLQIIPEEVSIILSRNLSSLESKPEHINEFSSRIRKFLREDAI